MSNAMTTNVHIDRATQVLVVIRYTDLEGKETEKVVQPSNIVLSKKGRGERIEWFLNAVDVAERCMVNIPLNDVKSWQSFEGA